jgi:UDP-N-acetylmuramoyl-L-alanyl-D-glutamate--2,6-diaminopimelate ligase
MNLTMDLLNRLFRSPNHYKLVGDLPSEIVKIAYHTNQVENGTLFVCIKGYEVDGHRYLSKALELGAIVAVVEDLQDVNIPQIVVPNSRLALALLSSAFYGDPSKKLYTIGITATNGKTSTSFMVDSILKAARFETGIIGTVMTRYKDQLIPSFLTTPESLDLQGYFKDMLSKGVSHLTMEVSSSGQELNRVGGIEFNVVAFNNVSPEHIDQHGSYEAYLYHKSKLIKHASADAWAILNADDVYTYSLYNQTQAKVLTFGIENKNADLQVVELDLSSGRAQMTVELKRTIQTAFGELQGTKFDVKLSVAGYHSVINALSAIACTLVSGIDLESIKKGLLDYQGVERRFEIIYEHEFKIVDDHFANSGNIEVTMQTLDMMSYNNLIMLYAIRGSRGVTTNKENALVMAKWAHKLGLKRMIATLSQSHVGKKDTVLKEELDVFLEVMKNEGIHIDLFNELPDALDAGLDRARQGDLIMLAGCQGMDYAGKIILEKLALKHDNLDPLEIMKPLRHRVCGMEPL